MLSRMLQTSLGLLDMFSVMSQLMPLHKRTDESRLVMSSPVVGGVAEWMN